jgi:hypothetical protein
LDLSLTVSKTVEQAVLIAEIDDGQPKCLRRRKSYFQVLLAKHRPIAPAVEVNQPQPAVAVPQRNRQKTRYTPNRAEGILRLRHRCRISSEDCLPIPKYLLDQSIVHPSVYAASIFFSSQRHQIMSGRMQGIDAATNDENGTRTGPCPFPQKR